MTDETISFRAARPGDGGAIARLLASVQSVKTLPLTLWSSPRAHFWVEDLLAGAQPELGIEYSVVETSQGVEGVICIRPVDGNMLVDNVFIAPRLRRMQMSAPLIRWATGTFNRANNYSTVSWDVWAHERALIAWYKQLGGVEQFRRNWLSVDPESGTHSAEITGIEKALECYERHGFASVVITTSQKSYTVGMLSSHAFRITDGAAVHDRELLAALASLDPGRKARISCTPEETPEGMEPVATAIRMHAPYQKFLNTLARYTPGQERKQCTASC